IDRLDNGIGTIVAGDVASLVDAMNPQWDSDTNPDALFRDAAGWAGGVLARSVATALSRERARGAVLDSVRASEDPRIVVLPKSMPWEDTIFGEGVDEAIYVVYPDKSTGGWLCTAVPPERGAFGQKVPLPQAWRGLRGQELVEA